jgi:2-methylcitrate dehydratase PrpD
MQQPVKSIVRRIADWAVEYRTDEYTARRIRATIRDFVGCAAAGMSRPEMAPALSLASQGDVPVPGSGAKHSPASAAFTTAVAGSMLQLHDVFPDCGLHPSSSVIPACWAAFYQRSSSTKCSTVDAIAAGYEVAYRIAAAGRLDPAQAGYVGTAAAGAIGAAVATSLVLGHDATGLANAISNTTAVMPVALPIMFREHGELTPIHNGIVARAGYEAAMLARHGDNGILLFEGDDRIAGLASFLSADTAMLQPACWHDDPISRLAWKFVPTCFATQTALEALWLLPRFEPGDVSQITVAIPSRLSWLVEQGPRAGHLYDRLMSMRWAIAMAVCHGRYQLADLDVADAQVDRITEIVEIASNPDYNEDVPLVWTAAITLAMRDGQVLRAEHRHEAGRAPDPQGCGWTDALAVALLDDKYADLTQNDCSCDRLLSRFLNG